MSWILYAGIAAAALAAADVFVKLAAGRVPNSLGSLLYGAMAFVVGLAWFLVDRSRGSLAPASTDGIGYALAVGAWFSLVTVGLYGAFQAGAPLSVLSPVVRLAGLIVASVCGLLIWNEPVTPRYVLGLCLSAAGVYFIVTR
jgi:drug/metabolite transporter (DMT)-like permease